MNQGYFIYLCVTVQTFLPEVGLRARFLRGAFFRGIELPCQFVAPLTHASQPIDRSFLNITNRKKTKDEERKSTRIILLYLAEQPQKRSVAE